MNYNKLLNDLSKLVLFYPVYTGILAVFVVAVFLRVVQKRREKRAFIAYIRQCFKPLKMLCLAKNFKSIPKGLKADFNRFGQTGGYILGCFRIAPNEPPHFLAHQTNKHLLSIAPTRTGKGRGLILPNLLDLPDYSVFVIDPKAENALVSATYRQSLGHKVIIFNPYGEKAEEFTERGFTQFQSFNPLASLDPESLTFAADVTTIAEALIYHTGGDSHWTESAQGLVEFLIMYLVAEQTETPTLRRLRSIIAGGHPAIVDEVLKKAKMSILPIVQDNVGRYVNDTNEVHSIIGTAETQTRILKNEAICLALEGGKFDFEFMKHSKTSVYLILPSRYLIENARYLRLVLLVAMSHFLRSEEGKHRVLAVLDEFANLGVLKVIENGYGLIAGHGVTLWTFVQNLTQLKTLYPNNWEVFIANSAAVTVSNVNDVATAEYFSKRAGQRQVSKVSHSQGSSLGNSQSGTNISEVWEDTLPTSELYAAHTNRIYVFAEGKSEPVRAFKLFYDLNEPFKNRAAHHPMHKVAARDGQSNAVYADSLTEDFLANRYGKKPAVPRKSWWLFGPILGTVELAKFALSVIGLAAGVTGLIYLGAKTIDEYVDNNRESALVKATKLDQVAGYAKLRKEVDRKIAAPIGSYERTIELGLLNGKVEENLNVLGLSLKGEQEGFDEKEYQPPKSLEKIKKEKPASKPKDEPQ